MLAKCPDYMFIIIILVYIRLTAQASQYQRAYYAAVLALFLVYFFIMSIRYFLFVKCCFQALHLFVTPTDFHDKLIKQTKKAVSICKSKLGYNRYVFAICVPSIKNLCDYIAPNKQNGLVTQNKLSCLHWLGKQRVNSGSVITAQHPYHKTKQHH